MAFGGRIGVGDPFRVGRTYNPISYGSVFDAFPQGFGTGGVIRGGAFAQPSTWQSRTDLFWESAGALGASEYGPGIMDTTRPVISQTRTQSGIYGAPAPPDLDSEPIITVWDGTLGGGKPIVWTPTEKEPVAIDWGGLIGNVASQYIQTKYAPAPQFSGFLGPAIPPPAAGESAGGNVGGPNGITWGNGGNGSMSSAECGTGCDAPRYLTYDCKTGEFKKRRRRRRRRLLTSQDIADLSALVAVTGKGANLSMAVAKAVRG